MPLPDVIDQVAEAILTRSSQTILRVGIDGVDGVGKTTFADLLAQAIRSSDRPVIPASVDGFHNPRAKRYRRGKASPEGFFRDSYNYDALRRVLLDPLGPRGSRRFRSAVFDHITDTAVPERWFVADSAAVLIFDGIFLNRPELRDAWDISVFLDAPFEITIPRGAARGAAGVRPM